MWQQLTTQQQRSIQGTSQENANRNIDMIFWILSVVHRRALCMWRRLINSHVELGLLWGHYHVHWVDNWPSCWLCYCLLPLLLNTVLTRPIQSKKLSRVAILVFQFGLYYLVVPLCSSPMLLVRSYEPVRGCVAARCGSSLYTHNSTLAHHGVSSSSVVRASD